MIINILIYYNMPKTYRNRLPPKKRQHKKQTKKRVRNRAGMLKALRAIAVAVGLAFTQIYSADGHTIYTVCRGNTCRSPYYESMLRKYFGHEFTIGSFGTHPKNIGSKMAPETQIYAEELCENNQECIDRVNAHSSKRIDCAAIKQQIAEGEDITLIPMDQSVEIALMSEMKCFTLAELSHIEIVPNANITDPFPTQGTPQEKQGYANMKADVETSLGNIMRKIKRANPFSK